MKNIDEAVALHFEDEITNGEEVKILSISENEFNHLILKANLGFIRMIKLNDTNTVKLIKKVKSHNKFVNIERI